MYSDLVYQCPGPHQRPGGTFAYREVKSEAEHEEALAHGWFCTLPEAIEGKTTENPAHFEPPPTRDELEHKAKELGIKFDKKTKDEELSKKIAEALGA
jgi:hypothetical protein